MFGFLNAQCLCVCGAECEKFTAVNVIAMKSYLQYPSMIKLKNIFFAVF